VPSGLPKPRRDVPMRRRRKRTGRSGHLGLPAARHRKSVDAHYTTAGRIAREIVFAAEHGHCERAVDGFEKFGSAMGAAYCERQAAGERGHGEPSIKVWGLHDQALAAFRRHCPFRR